MRNEQLLSFLLIVKPDTLVNWRRQIVGWHWTFTQRRKPGTHSDGRRARREAGRRTTRQRSGKRTTHDRVRRLAPAHRLYRATRLTATRLTYTSVPKLMRRKSARLFWRLAKRALVTGTVSVFHWPVLCMSTGCSAK